MKTEKKKRVILMGGIFKRGKTFWIKYYRNGKPYREAKHTEKKNRGGAYSQIKRKTD
jgi:hypothetical protein